MIKGIIFDMDGTITKPYIDWRALRAEIGAPMEKTIIEHIDSLEPDRARWATEVLERWEEESSVNSEINEGVEELLAYLQEKGIKTALVTNNNGACVGIVLEKHDLRFDVALSRDDGEVKPSEDLIVKALERLGVQTEEAIVVGDGRFDVEASARAGVRSVYLCHATPSFEHECTIRSLAEVREILEGRRA